MKEGEERERLLRELRRSRSSVSRGLSGISHAFDVRERIERSVRFHPVWWIGGAAAAGLLLAGLTNRRPGRKGEETRRSPIGAAALGVAGPMLKNVFKFLVPALRLFALRQLTKWTTGFFGEE